MTETLGHHQPSISDRSATRWSYLSGTSDTPLLGMTIGDAFDRNHLNQLDALVVAFVEGRNHTRGQRDRR